MEGLFTEGAAEESRVFMVWMGEGAREECSRHQGRCQTQDDNHVEAWIYKKGWEGGTSTIWSVGSRERGPNSSTKGGLYISASRTRGPFDRQPDRGAFHFEIVTIRSSSAK